MTRDKWREAVLPPSATLSAALQSLDATALQIVLVLDGDGRLQGTLTDGDVRRALLRGETLNSSVADHMKEEPVTIAEGTDVREAMDVLRRMAIRSAPVVDTRGQVIQLVSLDDPLVPAERGTPAVIMAGGRGRRLRPLTDTIPKPLVSIRGEPLIDIAVRRLVSQGFRQIWVTTHYLPNEIKAHLGSGKHLGAEIRYITEPEPLGTAGAVREVPVSSADAPILVCNSDNLHTIDFCALIDHHTSSGALATLAVTEHITEVPFGVVTIRDGFVTNLVEKPHRTDWVATGVSVLTQEALSLFPTGKRLDVPVVILELLNRGLPAGAFESRGYWSDVGNPATLDRIRAEQTLRKDATWPSES